MGTGEEVVLPAQGQRAYFILDLVIVDLDAAVFKVGAQAWQVIIGVVERDTDTALAEVVAVMMAHPFEQGFVSRLGVTLAQLLPLLWRTVIVPADPLDTVQVLDSA